MAVTKSERGSLLISELIAVAIIALALIVLIIALATGSQGALSVRQRAAAESMAMEQIELIKSVPYSTDPSDYPLVANEDPYSVDLTVMFWNGSDFQATTPTEDLGLQKVTVEVYSSLFAGSPVLILEDYKADR